MSVIPLNAPRLTVSPGVTLSEEYTDNFFLTERNKVENFRTRLTGSLSVLLNYPNTQGSLSGGVQRSLTTPRPDEEHYSFFPSFTGTLTHSFNPRMKLTVSDTYIRDDDPSLSNPSNPNEASLRGERDKFSVNTFSISLSWLIDIVQTQVYYRNSLFFDDEKTMSHIFGANASMPVGARNTVSVGYEFTTRDTTDDTTVNTTGQTFGPPDIRLVLAAAGHVHLRRHLDLALADRLRHGLLADRERLPLRRSRGARRVLRLGQRGRQHLRLR